MAGMSPRTGSTDKIPATNTRIERRIRSIRMATDSLMTYGVVRGRCGGLPMMGLALVQEFQFATEAIKAPHIRHRVNEENRHKRENDDDRAPAFVAFVSWWMRARKLHEDAFCGTAPKLKIGWTRFGFELFLK